MRAARRCILSPHITCGGTPAQMYIVPRTLSICEDDRARMRVRMVRPLVASRRQACCKAPPKAQHSMLEPRARHCRPRDIHRICVRLHSSGRVSSLEGPHRDPHYTLRVHRSPPDNSTTQIRPSLFVVSNNGVCMRQQASENCHVEHKTTRHAQLQHATPQQATATHTMIAETPSTQ